MRKESIANIVLITTLVCLVCSVVVSTAAVGLRPLYEENKRVNLHKSILEVAGIEVGESNVDDLFSGIEIRLLELESGQFADIDLAEFDARVGRGDPAMSKALSKREDIARIVERPNYAKVYLLKRDGVLDKVILPVHGYGLWSVLYGFVALEEDGNTIYNIKFYEHAETPGLGGEVDNPKWRALWHGKYLYDSEDLYRFEVTKGRTAEDSEDYPYRIDGLAGATLTSYGVSQMMRFWMGQMGYKPFLDRLTAGATG